MISIIITAWKEPDSIKKAIKCLADSKYSGISKDFELIQVSPDKETLDLGLEAAKELKIESKYIQIKDPLKGKPFALNLALKKAKGQILILADGDVYAGKKAVKYLVDSLTKSPRIGGVACQPQSLDKKDNQFGYYGHLLVAAANHRRQQVLNVEKGVFPLSGDLMAIRKMSDLKVPAQAYTDDAYISYFLYNKGYQLVYQPKAKVMAKYPKSFKDFVKQKKRSMGGHSQLKEFGVLGPKTKQSRSFSIELKYFWFPVKFASNLKELWWSLLLYPTRLIVWLVIWWENLFKKSEQKKVGPWERIESTK